jgi:hypothetical protein
MPASFLLTLTALQLDVVRDALCTCGHHGCGRFEGAQDWWGNTGIHGEYGNTIRERLDKVSALAQKVEVRGIQGAPERTRVAWDIAAAIRLAQAAHRLKKPVDYAMMPRMAKGPPARVDPRDPGTRNFMASLDSLKDVPLPPTRKKPAPPVVPELFVMPPAPAVIRAAKKDTALIKKKKKVKKSHA